MTEQDDAVLTLVGESFDGVRMDRDAGGIVARGRTLRRRRRAVPALAAAGVAAVTALAVALPSTGTRQVAGVSGSGTGSGTARQAVNVDLAAWSVHTNADATITVTMRELYDADLLRQVLAKAGVRAVVQYVSVDKQLNPKKGDQPGSVVGIGCVPTPGVHALPQIEQVLGSPEIRKLDNGYLVMTIRPSAMPAGSLLSFVIFDVGPAHFMAAATDLLDGAPQKCVRPVWTPKS